MQFKQLALQRQGLTGSHSWQGEQGTLQAIEQLGYVQIDSINVVERAHHHCLWSRVQDYQPAMLDALLRKRQIFEYWSHAAAFLPMQDFRFGLWRMRRIAEGEKHWFEKNAQLANEVLARIRAEGPLSAADFEHSGNSSGWWNWKPAKKALEQLFMEGELMVSERRNFQKVYDLTERVLPANVDTRLPSDEEFARYLINRYLHAHGIGTAKQMGYLRKGAVQKTLQQCLKQMLEAGELHSVKLHGNTYYMHRAERDKALAAPAAQLHLLSPFDNSVIQRERLKTLFGFDYQIECYVPKHKRQHGYFCLPILWNQQFVGRMDVKAERKVAVLQVLQLNLEADFVMEEAFIQALRNKLKDYAQFNGCKKYQVKAINRRGLLRPLNKA
ncbi:winged helix-turn-helix domain-containing protein [Bowmanella denitrificans]|uniref:winged helix-turn-helix domain-containing protein n=1 Tax=Bowmanella denitrificans TaxID=366582 RepID=UPI001FE7E4C4|nr:crosslink repair DNA glycosylase YcaQ family protein [Bowmanella denitrificans]